jgi:hypothetical protein
MTRSRISTTVDHDRLQRARRLSGLPDSQLIDAALRRFVADLEAAHEQDVLAAAPYEDDPDLAWEVPLGPDLPYTGEVPADVRRLAAERRGRYHP